MKKLRKDIEREANGEAKQTGLRGRQLGFSVQLKKSMAEYENNTYYAKTLNRKRGDVF